MRRTVLRYPLILALAIACGMMLACSEDDPAKVVVVDPGPQYENLTEPGHVLHNLELAYNEMNIERLRELVDSDEFIFYFAANEPDGSWTCEQFETSMENIFTGKESRDPRYGKINGIQFDLLFAGATWDDVVEPGFENETWKEVIANYFFQFDADPDWTMINGEDAKAVLTVRQVMDAQDNRMEWRLVRARDLGLFNRAPARGTASSTASEQYTWGRIISLYLL